MSLLHLIYGKTGDATYQAPRIDASTHSLQVVTYEHHEIHAGSSFTASYSADIGNGANLDIAIVTPDTAAYAHMTYEFDVEAEADLKIYEAATLTPGTAIAAYNRNRNSATAAAVSVTHTPTGITTGTTIIRDFHVGSGKTFGGGDRSAHEFILKRNTTYLLRLNNATTGANYMAIKLDWYEHTDKTA